MNNLKEIREEKKLLQKDIANILNMTQNGYSKYETESNDIPIDILIKLSNFYQVSTDYLLGLTKNKNRLK